MSENKTHQFRPPLYTGQGTGIDRLPTAGRSAELSKDQQGWDAYRKWLARIGRQPEQRAPVDHSIYSWKGYNSWAERIRQSWKSEES